MQSRANRVGLASRAGFLRACTVAGAPERVARPGLPPGKGVVAGGVGWCERGCDEFFEGGGAFGRPAGHRVQSGIDAEQVAQSLGISGGRAVDELLERGFELGDASAFAILLDGDPLVQDLMQDARHVARLLRETLNKPI